MYSVVVKQSQADRERGNERKEERKRERENWLLLDSFRRCSSSSCHFSIRREQSHLGPCEQVTGGAGGWRRPLLTRVGVSRGDRSKELLTGGSWHRTAPGPRDAASAHLSTGNWNGNAGTVRSCVFPSAPVVLLLYFAISLTPVWKTVRGMKYWCDLMCLILHFAVRVRAPGSFPPIAFGDTRG